MIDLEAVVKPNQFGVDVYRANETVTGVVSTIIPVRNEQWCIASLVQKFSKIIDRGEYIYEIIFVDGASDDQTCEIIENLQEEMPEIRLLKLTMNFGVTQAIVAGIENSEGEYIVTMDGNLQNDPEDIPRMISKLSDDSDICLGWRTAREEGVLTVELPSVKYNKLVSWVTGIKFHDHECSLKAYRYSCLEGIGIYGSLHHYIHIYASMYGARLCELPITQFPRAHGYGEKEYFLKSKTKRVLDIILLGFFIRYAQRPLYVFGSLGLVSLGSAIAIFLIMLVLRLMGAASFIETPLPTAIVAFGMIGILLILIGILAEFVVRIYFELRGQRFYKIKPQTTAKGG